MKLSPEELVALVQRLIDAEGSEEEEDAWAAAIASSVPMPIADVIGLIFHPPDGQMPKAEDVVAKALAYKPNVIQL